MNSLVLSGTAPIVPSGTGSTCYQGPESLENPGDSETWGSRNFSNKESFGFFLTGTPESARCGSAGSERLSLTPTAGRGASAEGSALRRNAEYGTAISSLPNDLVSLSPPPPGEPQRIARALGSARSTSVQ